MERLKIKCPICGNTEFIEINTPYRTGMDTYIEDYTSYFACTNCGLVLRFAKQLADSAIEQEFRGTIEGKECIGLEKQAKDLRTKIDALNKKIESLKKEKENPNRTVKRDAEISVEMDQCKKDLKASKSELEACENRIAMLRAKKK